MQAIQHKHGVLLATVDHIAGYEIVDVQGGVCSHRVRGTSFLSDWLAGISDRWGGRARGYEDVLANATEAALADLAASASRRGGNAVFGLRLNMSIAGKGLIIVTLTGTALTIRQRPR